MQIPFNFQVQLTKYKITKSPFQVHFTICSCCYWSLRLQESVVPFYASSTGTNKAESSLRRHWQLRIASESHSSSGRFIPLPPFVPCFIHCRCSLSSSFSESWFLFYLPNFFFFFFSSFAHFCLTLFFRLSLICLTFSKHFFFFFWEDHCYCF